MVRRIQTIWLDEDFGPTEPASAGGEGAIEGLEQKILALAPHGEAQTWYRSQALQMGSGIAQVRFLLSNQMAGTELPTPFLVVLVSRSAAIFVSFGLFARPNGTVIVSLLASAMAVAGAIFLILELSSPFAGIIRISSAPARATLALLGQ